MEMVILGLKYVAENQQASNQEISSKLKEMGWNYTWEDFYFQFPLLKLRPLKYRFFKGVRRGRIWAGANILINLSNADPNDSLHPRDYYTDWFLREDNNMSIYHFIRKATKDRSYKMSTIKSN